MSASFECLALGPGPLEVLSLRGVEALNEPYSFEVVVRLPDIDADPTLLFEQDAALTLRRGFAGGDFSERRFVGLCYQVEELGIQLEFAVARVVLRPALIYGDLGRRTRVFQDKTALEVIEEVLGDLLGAFGRSFQNDVKRIPPTREYCVQYAESDLTFVSRLMEEEAIVYAFEYNGDVEQLILWDSPASVVAITTQPSVPFSDTAGRTEAEAVVGLSRLDRTQATAFAVRDHEWTLDALFVEHPIEGEGAQGRTREVYEHGRGRSITHHGYSGRYAENDLEARTTLRSEELTQDAETYHGHGHAIGFAAGAKFELTGHPDPLLDATYTLRRVHHRIADEGAGSYANAFEAHLVDAAYRPPRVTAKPSIPGSQTAIVTGPAGEEIHVDEHGRIKVQFDWDRVGADDEKSSCWVRCGEAWSGGVMGTLFRPRIGMEVLVSFVHGDPDRPLVNGCLYNGVNVPPYALPDDKTKSTIKSESTLGGGGFNELRFEDLAGSEQVFLHAQKDLNEVVLNNHTTTVGGDQLNDVGNDQTQLVKANQTEQIDGTQTMTVGGDRTVVVDGDFTELVICGETRKVTGGSDETILSSETHFVIGATTELIFGGEERFVAGGFTETIIGDVAQVVMGPATYFITGTQDITALGGVTITTPAAFMLSVSGTTDLIGMAGGTITSPASTLIMATTIGRQAGFWDFISPMSTSTVGTDLSMTGVKLQGGILAAGAGGFKAELKQIAIGKADVKAAAIAVNVDLWLLDLDTDGAKPDGFAFYLYLP